MAKITQIEIEQFLKEWEMQLKQVAFILQYLHTYPEILNGLGINYLIKPEQLIRCQSDWIRLCEAFKGTPEEYYQPQWVPVNVGFDYFIDLSDENYVLFQVYFDDMDDDNLHYRRIEVFNSIQELMLAEENGENLESIRMKLIWDKSGRYVVASPDDLPSPLC